MIIRFGTLNLVNYPKYPPELELHLYEDNEEIVFYDAPTASSLPAGYKPYIYIYIYIYKEAVDRISNQKKNLKIKNLREEIERKKKSKRSIKNIMKNI